MVEQLAVAVHVEAPGFVMTLIIGGVAGWLAGQITRRRGFGILRNIIIGILGSLLGGIIFDLLGLAAYGFIGRVVMATIGALLLIYLLTSLTSKRR